MSEEKKLARIKVAALWKNVKDGTEYLSGNWGEARILIFPNGFKERETQPDSYMYLTPRPPPARPEANETN